MARLIYNAGDAQPTTTDAWPGGDHRHHAHDPALGREDGLELALSREEANQPDHSLLIAILGPTASGKTALSLHLAEEFDGEVVNCDSVAVYREFEIGTAKPSRAERERVPHHLIDIVAPDQEFTAGDYGRLARDTVRKIAARGKVPIVVGGTGLYLRALLDGLFTGPPRSEELRERLRERAIARSPKYLHRILRRMDAVAAATIHENDLPKLIRAIEVCLSAKQPITEMWKEGREPLRGFRIIRIGLNPDRSALYSRINERSRKMFDSGLVNEIETLLQRYGDAAKQLGSHGYRQAVQLLRGEIDREQAIAATAQVTRNYAKRQWTWFRREPDVHWLDGFGNDETVQHAAFARVREKLFS